MATLTPEQRNRIREWMDVACTPFKNMTLDRVFDCPYDVQDLERQFTVEFGSILKYPSDVFHQMLQARCKPPEDDKDEYED